jgi:hypothetical protein
VGVSIAYLDATPGETCQIINFPDGADPAQFPPIVRLLYRPGHYDVVYPK